MANKEQLENLKQGKSVWRQWYDVHLGAKIDLTGADLRGVNLQGAALRHADLRNANLEGANLKDAFLADSDLRDANLGNANLSGAGLEKANLSRSSLEEAHLIGANLSGANLTEASLWGADLWKADLTGTNLTNSILIKVNFYSTNLLRTKFTNSIIGFTNFAFSDLSQSLELETIRHSSSSSIGTETMLMSTGKIPAAFLRGCGLSDLQIEMAKLADPDLDPEQVTDITHRINQLYLGRGIRYTSCFISYNSQDEEFAKQLHNDLQDNGVRCWFAPEDMKIGDSIWPTIDRQIRLRDKLLRIVSRNSLQSEYVSDEVEAALEAEKEGKRTILYPIRLDDTVLNTRDDWVAKIKRRRHIGDFSNWQDKSSYQKAFERLLKDLKATGGS